jgi:predicted dehydrogenase
MEAFMYRHHPQWQRAREMVAAGRIGALRTVHSFFSYRNVDPGDIRNVAEMGGGGLLDIGCYCVSVARFLFGIEPERAFGIVELDPVFEIDRLASGVLDFGVGTATFTCSTQLVPHQRVRVFGTEGAIEIEIPFNPPPDDVTRIWHRRAGRAEEIAFEPCNQYTLQGDLFSLAVLEDTAVPTPLEDAVANMRVIEAVAQSARSGEWVRCAPPEGGR